VSEAALPAAVVPGSPAEDVRAPGVAVFDGDWTLVSVDQATADLLGRRRAELTGRNIWIALPELAGTIFHSFLLHARSCSRHRCSPATWRSPSATCRPRARCRSAATGTTPSSSPTARRCW
jgi:phosphoserine phosphatase RsbU/P